MTEIADITENENNVINLNIDFDKKIPEFIAFKEQTVSNRTAKMYSDILTQFKNYSKTNGITGRSIDKYVGKNTYKKNVIKSFFNYFEIEIEPKKQKKEMPCELEIFLNEINNLSEKSLTSYKNYILNFYEKIGEKPILEYEPKDVWDYLHGSYQNKNSQLSALKKYFNFYDHNICRNIFINKQAIKNELTRARQQSYLTEKETAILNNWFNKEHITKTDIMDKMILYTVLENGIRVSELKTLQRKNIMEQTMEVDGSKGKNDVPKVRYVTMNDNYIKAVNAYIEKLNLGKEDFLIHNNNHKEFSLSGLENRIRLLLEKLGLRSNGRTISIHKFRHTYATNLYNKGVPLEYIREQMGHESIDTTLIYAHINDKNKTKHLSKSYSDTSIKI